MKKEKLFYETLTMEVVSIKTEQGYASSGDSSWVPQALEHGETW